jgi:hypothetical protein
MHPSEPSLIHILKIHRLQSLPGMHQSVYGFLEHGLLGSIACAHVDLLRTPLDISEEALRGESHLCYVIKTILYFPIP